MADCDLSPAVPCEGYLFLGGEPRVLAAHASVGGSMAAETSQHHMDLLIRQLTTELERGAYRDRPASDLGPGYANVSSLELVVRILIADLDHYRSLSSGLLDEPATQQRLVDLIELVQRIR
jgi:hypothetical protein